MEPLIFYEKNFSNGFNGGGSEPNHAQLMKSGAISFDGHDNIKSLGFYFASRDYFIYDLRLDGEHYYSHAARSIHPENQFDIDFWRSGQSELSYRITLRSHPLDENFNAEGLCNGAYNFTIELENGEKLLKQLPFSIVQDTTDDDEKWENQRQDPIKIVASNNTIPANVNWDFGGLENVYVPGNQADTYRYQAGGNSSFDPSNTCWGVTKDAAALFRVYEDALPPETSLNIFEINPSGYGIRNYKSTHSLKLEHEQKDLSSIKVIHDGHEYNISTNNNIINIYGGQINFRSTPSTPYNGVYTTTVTFEYELDNNISHDDSTRIDAFNQHLIVQATDHSGNVATKDILVQIIDDAPFVTGEATIDLTGVAAWTLGGDKLPLSYEHFKDVLYRSTDYVDWTTGFKVTNCEGKYGSIGVFADDANPNDPASAAGNIYYMVDPEKITFVPPDQVVTETVEYTYTDSDGDTINGVLNILLKGSGLNPAEAIAIAPRPGNAPTSGGDVPADNPYVPGNPDDPDRDTTIFDPAAEAYDPMNPNWGLDKDGNALLRVFESGLPNGSEAGQRNVAAHGYLYIDATVGLQSLVATTNSTDRYGFENNMMSIPLNGGTLTLTQNPGEDFLRYEFTLANAIMHEPEAGINSAEQYVQLIATDNFGNEEMIGLEVQIIDDASRILVADTSHELGANAVASVTGNIGDYIIRSADPDADNNWWTDPEALKAAFAPYGTLTLGDDGAYAFTLDPHSAAFQAIPAGESVNLELPFQYRDQDGDAVSGAAQFNITGTVLSLAARPGNVPTSGGDVPIDNPFVPGNPADPDRDLNSSEAGDYDPMNPNWGRNKDGAALLRVFESGLDNGSEAGERNVTAHGTIDIEATTGLQTLLVNVGGEDVYIDSANPFTINIPMEGGTLTFNKSDYGNSIDYQFTLTNAVRHDPGQGINSLEQQVKLTAIDNLGIEKNFDLQVQIIDDVPGVFPAVTSMVGPMPAGAQYSFSFPAWNYAGAFYADESCSSLLGADQTAEAIQNMALESSIGNYGSFSLNNNPDSERVFITYEADPEKLATLKSGELAVEQAHITYTDADGDSGEMYFQWFMIGPGAEPRMTINESELADGTVIELEGFEITGVARQGEHGVISQGEDGLWRYNLTSAMDSGAVQGSNTMANADSFILTVKSPHYYSELPLPFNNIDIIDSVPTFTAGENRLAYDFGADNGPGIGLKVAVQGAERDIMPGMENIIAGRHGLLTLSADGSLHYAANWDYAGVDRFDFTIIDADGDRALAAVMVSLADGAPQMAIEVQDADSLAEAQIAALGISGYDGGVTGA